MLNKLREILRVEGLSGIKIRVYGRFLKAKYRYLSIMGRSTVSSAYGVKLKKNWLDAGFIYYVYAQYGTFYSEHLKSKNEEFAFLDIGAYQGLYTLLAGKNTNCCNAVAFEPVKSTYEFLKSNVQLNDIEDKCTLINKGLGKNVGKFNIFVPEEDSGCASLNNHFDTSEKAIEETIEIVNGKIFDTLFTTNTAIPIVCKIDVEGREKEIIETMVEHNFIGRVSEIFYEVDTKWLDEDAIENLLRSVGFKEFKKLGDGVVHYDILASR